MRDSIVRVLVVIAAASVFAVDGELSVGSKLGQRLLSQSRRLDQQDQGNQQNNGNNNNNYEADYSFLTDYAVKFQGCHHVQQWNEDYDDEDDVRIMTKRLIRYRLCPSDSCSDEKTAGCNSKYGDYVVDMDTFLEAYLESIQEDKDDICHEAYADCYNQCNGSNDADCKSNCYESYELSWCMNDDDNMQDFDVQEYSACKEVEFDYNNAYYKDDDDGNNGGRRRRRRLEDGDDDQVNYYVGAYCADQGGSIRLALFTDDTCTTFSSNGYDTFYKYMGYEMPFKSESLVTSRCLSCLKDDDDGNQENRELCEDVYSYSGKCETRMSVEYPNESSCNYIEGIKIVRSDGVIRTSTTKKSKAAAVAIGLFTTLSVLLGGYVYYLRTKLGRAQINLAAANQPLSYS